MVAAISGSGLGLYNTSATNLNGQGAAGTAPEGKTGEAVYVNTATGNLVLQDSDEVLAAEGLDVAVVRTYNSQAQFNGGIGQNWRLGVEESLSGLTGTVDTAGSTISKTFGDGATVTYTYNSTLGLYSSTAGPSANDTLSFNATSQQWTWTDSSSRLVEVYGSSGQLLSSTDSSGNAVTYGYSGSLLTQITDASGQVTTFTYSGGNISQISTQSDGVTQTLVRYSYDTSGRLSQVTVDLSPQDNSVTDGNVYVTTYTYQGTTNLVSSITQSDGTQISFAYQEVNGEYQLASYTDGLGNKTTLTYSSTGTSAVTVNANSNALQDTSGGSALTSGGTQSTTTYNLNTGDTSTTQTSTTTENLNSSATSTTETTNTTTNYSLNNSKLTTPTVGWQTPSRLTTQSYSAGNPNVGAIDNSGDVMMLWSADGNVFAGTYSRPRNAFSTPALLSTLTSTVYAPSLATDATSGNAVAAWVQSNGTTETLYVSHYSASTGTWSAPAALESSSNAVQTGAGSVTTAINGQYAAVTWVQSNGTTNRLYAARYNGTSWSAASAIDAGNGNPAAQPTVAIDASGNVMALWQQSNGTTSSIYANHFSASTGNWGGATLLESSTSAAATPTVRFDSSGNAFAVWTLPGAAYEAHYSVSTGAWSTPVNLATNGNTAYTASLSVDASGNALVAWIQSNGTNPVVYVAQYSASAGTWSATSALESTAVTLPAAGGSVVAAIAGSYAAVSWVQPSGSQTAVYMSTFSAGAWSASTQVSNNAAQPSISLDAGGNLSIMYEVTGNAPQYTVSVFVELLSGSAWSGALQVFTPAPAVVNDPQIGMDANGDAVAVWLSGGLVDSENYTQSTDILNSYTASLSGSLATSYSPSLAVDAAGNAVGALVKNNGSGVPQVYVALQATGSVTWTTARALGSATQPAATVVGSVATARNGQYAAVAWVQSDGTTNRLYVSIYNGSTWSTAVAVNAANSSPSAQPTVAIDASGNVMVLWQQSDGTASSIYANHYSVSSGTWSGASLLESSSTAASTPRLGFDGSGNGFAVWSQGGALYEAHYSVSSGTWSAPVNLAANANSVSAPSLSVDSAGDALAAWIQSNGTKPVVYVSSYNAARGTWTAATAVESSSAALATGSGNVVTAINGSYAAVGWIQANGSVNSLYTSVLNGTTWGAAALMGSANGFSASAPSLAIDSAGNVLAVWQQSTTQLGLIGFQIYNNDPRPYYSVNWGDTWSSIAQTLYGSTAPASQLQSQMGNPTLAHALRLKGMPATESVVTTTTTTVAPYYTVVSGDTWSSIAQKLYGTTAAASQLQTQLGNPALTVGAQLTNLPATETVTTTTTVPPYYTVVSGDTWSSIAQKLYGTTAAATQLQTQQGSPALTVGTQLTNLPSTEAVITTSGGTGLYYAVKSGDTWSSITQALYGTSAANAVTALKTALSNPTLTTGEQLTGLPSTLSYSLTTTGTAPSSYTVQAGDSWTSITQALYGTSNPNAAAALQSALSSPTLLAGVALTGLPASLTYTQSSSLLALPYYVVQPNDTWATIALAIYGTSDLSAAAVLQSVLGNPTLTTGLQLTIPATLTYTPTVAGSYSTQTLIKDPLGNTTTLINDSNGRLVEIESPVVNGASPEMQFTYGANGKLAQVSQYDEGTARSTVYQYDSNGNLILSRDADGNTVTRTYDAANQVLTQTTYSVADPNGASPLNTASAMTTWYVYDSDERLSFILSPTGDVTEYLYDSHGNRTSQVVFAGAQYNVSGLTTTTCPTLAQMQSWAGSQNLTQTERTDYTYDFRGNLSTETVYTATSSTGAGAGTPSTTQYVYDQYGELLQVIDPRGSTSAPNASNPSLPYATTYTYDGLGRVLSETQWVSSGTTEATLYQHDDASNTVTTTAANGLITTSVYNADDELVSQSESANSQSLGTTTYTYDADGLLRTVTNPDGIESHILYDADGRKVATVDGNGVLTQYAYNAAGQVIETIVYAGTVNTASLADVSGAPANVPLATLISEANTSPAANAITRSVYDAAGRLIYSIDDAGAVTENLYDGAGRLTDVIAYATPVSIPASTGELTPAQVAVVTSANDRHARNFYDANGDLAGALDAAGYLTTYQYDAAGELVQKTAYATATTASLRASGTLAQLIPASDAVHDVVEHYFYDGEGRQVGVIDGDGYLTQTQYDTAGNIAETIRYAMAVTYTAGATLASLIPTGSSETTLYQYDGENRLVQETNYQQTVTQYQYDAVGNLISTTVAPGTADVRTTQTRYDALGRVIAELTPQGSAAITSGMSQTAINAIWAQYGVTYAYDAAGLKVSMTDQAGNTTHYYYDDDGRLRYTVNAAGDVTETRYDALGRVTDQTTYNATISTSGLTGGLVASSNITSLVQAVANVQFDGATTSIYGYDAAGRTETTATAEGDSVTQQYDAFGDVVSSKQSISTSQSVTTDYVYDARGLLTKTVADPIGLDVVQSSQYDAFGRVTQSKDADGNVTTYGYDRLGRQVQVTDALSAITGAAYDAFGRLTSTTDALGNKTTYSYVDTTRTMTVTSQDGVTVSTVDNEYGQKVKVTDGNGNVTTYGYDANGDLTGTTDKVGLESGATYDAAGRLATTTDGNGVVTSYIYDAANRVHQKILDPTTANPNGLQLTTTYSYDGQGRVTSTTSSQGVVTTTQYDRDGRVTLVTVDPTGLNLQTKYTYDDTGNVLTVTQGYGSSNPRLTQYFYDALGRKTSQVIDPGTGTNPLTNLPYLNLTTQYYYDSNGNLVNEVQLNTLPNGAAQNTSTWYVYDADNRLHYTINSLGGITETDYDIDGRVSATISYANAMTPPAASVHQVTTVTPVSSSDDRIEQRFYNGDGELEYSIDAAGTVTQSTYDGDGNVIQLRVIGGGALSGRYANAAAVTTALTSKFGSATALTSQDRVQWTTYDARGRAIVTIDALGAVTETQYDGDGNVIASTAYATLITPPASFVTSLTASIPSGGGVPTLTFNGGAPLTVASSSTDRTTRYWYDTAGRQIYELDAAGYVTQTQYNDSARTQTVKAFANPLANPQSITSTTTASQLASEITPTSGTTDAYTPEALPSAQSTPTSVVVGADQTTTTYYDADGRVSQVNDALNGNQYYGYDALGNKTSYTNQLGNTWTYEYDAAGRLIEEDTPPVSSTSASGTGSLATATETGPIVTQMTYDAFGNVENLVEGLVRKSDGTLDSTNARTTTYGYDALGRQISVTLPSVPIYQGIASDNYEATGGAVVTDTVQDTSTERPTTQVVYDTLGDEIASRDAAGNWTYKVYDSLGRVTYQIDALYNVTNYGYDQFGNQTTTTRYANVLSSSSSGSPATPAAISGSTLTDLEFTSQSGGVTTLTATNGGSSSAVYLAQTGQDRTITTTYDRDNRVKQVSQPAVSAFVPNADGSDGGALFTAPPTIFYDYNAFGQEVRTATLVDAPSGANLTSASIAEPGSSSPATDSSGNAWSYTYTYYDQMGNKSADVDADGYLTSYSYDFEGNLTQQVESAIAVSVPTAGIPVATPSVNDRTTDYQYDQLNRKVAQILAGVQAYQMGGSGTSQSATPESGNAYTYYTYDKVGNQTSVTTNVTGTGATATGATTYTYYDVLGRVVATVGPTSAQGDVSTDLVTPLTVMQRDVYGNLVVETQVAGGLSTLPAAGTAPTASNGKAADAPDNRTTIYLRDADGHVLETDQGVTGGNVIQYDAYDAVGNLVKQYQPANGTDTLVTFYVYDKLGRQTQVISPESLGGTIQISDQVTQYDAFGEVTAKGTDSYSPTLTPVYSEFFNYDAAGRVYLTNTGDGVYRAYLYDLVGNATGKLEEQSTSTAGLAGLSSPAAVVSAYNSYRSGNGTGLMFTQTRYDAMGNVLEERLPTYSSTTSTPIEPLDTNGVTVQTNSSTGITYLSWNAPADATLTPKLLIDNNSATFTTVAAPAGSGYGYQAEYAITGSSLSDGAHTYTIEYTRPDGTVTGVASGTFNVGQTVSDVVSSVGTVGNVTVSLSEPNLSVSWTPDNSSVAATLWLLVGGTWEHSSGVLNESVETATLTAPGPGTYQYRITDTLNGVTEAQGTGTVTITAASSNTSLNVVPGTTGTVSSIHAAVSNHTATVSWIADSDVTNSSLQLLVGGSWTGPYQVTPTEGAASVSFAAPAAGTYQYRIVDLVGGTTEAESTGTISFATALTNSSQGAGSVNNISSAVNGSAVGMAWTADSGVTSSVLQVLISGSWTSPTVTLSENTYSASFTPPATGQYQYRIIDLVNGETEAGSTGTLSYTAPTSSTSTSGSSSASAPWYSPSPVTVSPTDGTQGSGSVVSSSTPVQTPYYNEGGGIAGYTDSWSGTDEVYLSWLNLPSGSYQVNLYYNTASNSTYGISATATSRSFTVSGGSGSYLSWTDSGVGNNTFPAGGISSISYFQIYQGGTLVRDSRTAGVTTTTVSWAAPSDSSFSGALLYEPVGGSGYATVNATRSGGTFQVQLSELAPGTYNFVAETFQNTAESPTDLAQASGQFIVNSSQAYVSSQSGTPGYLSGVAVSGSSLTWAQAASGATVQVQLTGPATYNLTPSTSNGTNYSASFYGYPSGTYNYTISYISGGSTYLEGTGTLSINTTTNSTAGTVTPVGTPTPLGAVGGFTDLGNGVFGWTTTPNGTDTHNFSYYDTSSGTWKPVTVSAVSSGGTTYQSVNLSALAAGSYAYEVTYTASGSTEPYAFGRGTVTVGTNATVASPTQLASIGGFTSLGNGVLGWTTPYNGTDTPVFKYTVPATNATGTLAISTVVVSGTTYYSVNLASISGSPASISYEVDYTASGAAQPYAVGWGTVGITTTPVPAAASISTPTQLAAISGFKDLGNGVFGWTTPHAGTDTPVFTYTVSGGATGTLAISTVVVSGTTYYSVNLNGLPAGVTSVTFEVDYTASGAAQPYAVGGGTVSDPRTGSFGADSTASWLASHSNTTAAPTEEQTVDRWGNVISTINTAGATTDYSYNRYNELVTTTDPFVAAVSVAMASNGQTGTVSSGSGTFSSSNFYDFYGNLVGTEDADGNINGKTNNIAGQLISDQHADGGQDFYVYDAFGDQIEVITQASDVNGQITTYETRNAYDEAGRLVDTAQELTQGAFAATGAADSGFASDFQAFSSDQNVILNQYVYDQAGRRTASIDGESDPTQTAYDLHGNVISTTTPENAIQLTATTYYGYNLQNYKISETDPDQNTQSWSYDYWDHLTGHVDMSGTIYTYTYEANGSGLLSSETSRAPSTFPQDPFAGVNKSYTYDGANHLIELNDAGVNSTTTYQYDTAGRVDHQTTTDGQSPTGGGLIAEDSITAYDAMGRIENIYGLGYTVRYAYDKAGNRTEIFADYTTAVNQTSKQDLWYGYDKMNRVLISQGENTAGQGDTAGGTVQLETGQAPQGTILTYDWRGDRTSATTQGTAIVEFSSTDFGNVTGTTEDTYTYDGAARLIDTYTQSPAYPTSPPILIDARTYDRASRMLTDTSYQVNTNSTTISNTQQVNDYNPDGSLNWAETLEGGATPQGDQLTAMLYYTYEVTNESSHTTTEYSYYDRAGNLTGYQVAVHDPNNGDSFAYLTTDSFAFEAGDSYLEMQQSVSSQSEIESAPLPGQTDYTYNVDQQLVQFTDTTKSANNRDFLNNAQGQALAVVQGVNSSYQNGTAYGDNAQASGVFANALMSGPAFFQSDAGAQYFFYDAQGNSIGSYGQLTNGTMTANFDPNLTPISQQYPQAQPPQYVVQSGDTLALIAARVYGDASLWYVIAEANGLTQEGPDTQLTSVSEAPLAEGASLVIPNVVVDRSNNAQSFAPYDVSQVLGKTQPYQAPPPPPQAQGSACGTFGEILMFAVAAVVAYFVGPEVYGELSSTLGTLGAGIVAGATAATAGSVASQTLGIAIGEQSSFNWSEVASAALAGAVGGGLFYGETNGILTSTEREILNAAVDSTAGQEANIAFGLQKSFSWEAVAAAAIAAPIADSLGKDVSNDTNATLGTLGSGLVGKLTTGAIDDATYSLFTGGKINYAQLVGDSFGNAIGDGIADQQIGITPQQEQQMDGEIAASTGAKLAQDGEQINEDITAALDQERAQATAAGSTDTTTESPLTNNVELSSRVPLQPIVGPIQTPSLADIGQELETGMQQGSLPGGPDQWTTFFDPTAGQQVAQNRTTGDDLVWDSTNDEWNPAPEIPEIVISATREPTAAQYAADQQQLANQSNELAGEVFGSFGPYALLKGIYNGAVGAVADSAYIDIRLFGGSTQTADRWASYINRAQVNPGAVEQAMGQSASPYLQSAYQGLASVVGSDNADDLSHLAGLGLNSLGVLPAVEPLATVGSSLRESIGQLGDIFPSGSAGSFGTGGAPLRAQLGQLNLSLFTPGDAGAPSTADMIALDMPDTPSGLVNGNGNVLVNGEGTYGELQGTLPDGFQAHHLNQNAAFSSAIPRDEGFAIGIQGNAFTDPGTPHYEFHSSLEDFWNQYRSGGSFFGELPTNAQYGDAVIQALQDAGLSSSEAQRLGNLATLNRVAYGLSQADSVPRIPGRIYQSGGN